LSPSRKTLSRQAPVLVPGLGASLLPLLPEQHEWRHGEHCVLTGDWAMVEAEAVAAERPKAEMG